MAFELTGEGVEVYTASMLPLWPRSWRHLSASSRPLQKVHAVWQYAAVLYSVVTTSVRVVTTTPECTLYVAVRCSFVFGRDDICLRRHDHYRMYPLCGSMLPFCLRSWRHLSASSRPQRRVPPAEAYTSIIAVHPKYSMHIHMYHMDIIFLYVPYIYYMHIHMHHMDIIRISVCTIWILLFLSISTIWILLFLSISTIWILLFLPIHTYMGHQTRGKGWSYH